MGTTPLRLEGSDGTMKEMTTAEENYLAYQAGLYLADLTTGAVATLTTTSTGATSIGTYTNTFFNEAVGTTAAQGITSGSTATTLYQKSGSVSEASIIRPLQWDGTLDGIQQMDDTDWNSQILRIMTTIFTNQYPGTFRLGSSSPGADYSVFITNVFSDTQTDGTTVNYNIYQRDTMAAPTAARAMKIKQSSPIQLQEMTDAEIKANYGLRVQNRIMSSLDYVGAYQLRTSAQGAPSAGGSWVARGTATDTKKTTADANYTRVSTRDSTTNFTIVSTRVSTRDSTSNFTRDSTFNFTRDSTSNFTRNSTSDYIGDFTGNYAGNYVGTRDYTRNSTSDYLGDFTGNYIGNYIGDTDFTRNSTTTFTGDFTGNYTGNYIGDTNFTRNSTSDFLGNFVGNYTGDFIGDTNFTRTSTTNYTRTSYRILGQGDFNLRIYPGQNQFNVTAPAFFGNIYQPNPGPLYFNGTSWYMGNFVGDFVGNFAGDFVGTRNYTRVSTRDTTINYTGDFTGDYVGTRDYTRDSTRNSTSDFVGDFTGNYVGTRDYTRDSTRNSTATFTGDFTGNYIGDTDFTRVSTRNSTSTFTGDFTGDYTGNFTGDYTGNFIGDYTGNFVGNYTGDFTGDYIGNFTGNYTGDYAGETIQSSSTTVETYTLYVRYA